MSRAIEVSKPCYQGYVCSVDGSPSQRASGEAVLHFPRIEVFGLGLRVPLERPRNLSCSWWHMMAYLWVRAKNGWHSGPFALCQGEITLSICPLSISISKEKAADEEWPRHGQQSRCMANWSVLIAQSLRSRFSFQHISAICSSRQRARGLQLADQIRSAGVLQSERPQRDSSALQPEVDETIPRLETSLKFDSFASALQDIA